MSLEERLRRAGSVVEAQVAARIDVAKLLADLRRREQVGALRPVAVGVHAMVDPLPLGPDSTLAPDDESDDASRERVPSGRQRHEEKITFYCTAEELMDLEHARLVLRRQHQISVDRGRLVREALAQVLSELERDGADAALVKRLSSQ